MLSKYRSFWRHKVESFCQITHFSLISIKKCKHASTIHAAQFKYYVISLNGHGQCWCPRDKKVWEMIPHCAIPDTMAPSLPTGKPPQGRPTPLRAAAENSQTVASYPGLSPWSLKRWKRGVVWGRMCACMCHTWRFIRTRGTTCSILVLDLVHLWWHYLRWAH